MQDWQGFGRGRLIHTQSIDATHVILGKLYPMRRF